MALTKGFELLAERLQEAAAQLSHSDLRAGLADALRDYAQVPAGGACPWCGRPSYAGSSYCCCYSYIVDVFGSQDAGDVVFTVAGDMYRAPFTSTVTDGTRKHTIDFAAKVDVLPRTVYDEEVGEAVRANEAGIKAAGKPTINKRAVIEAGEAEIITDAVDLREGAVGLDGSAQLKLIAPGWGSTGYYSEAVLKRDGPKLFKAGTQNFWNHPTDTQESERPEGDLRDLASVLTEDAKYLDNGPAGPGLYAKAKVMSHFAEAVDQLAPHIGMSIRGRGISKEGTAEGRKGPIIEKLTYASSVDYVTRAGAGGKILQLFEAARGSKLRESNTQREVNTKMNEAELKALNERLAKLEESNKTLAADNRRLQERSSINDAGVSIDRHMSAIRCSPALKARVKRNVLEALTLDDKGNFDSKKLTEAFDTELKAEVDYLESVSPSGRVSNLGAAPATGTPEERLAAEVKENAETLDGLGAFFMGEGSDDKSKRMRESFAKGRAN